MSGEIQQRERRALWASIGGTALMAGLGVVFALKTHSEAILLDGVFSGIGLVMSLATLKVASLVQQPDDEHFHFGYAHFVPLINVIKSLLMIILCVFALLSSVNALVGGGRPMEIGFAVVYGTLATAGCLAVALYLRRSATVTGSPLVAVDASGWIIDTMMSAAVLLSFIVGFLLKDSALGVYLPYLDPGVVTLLCLLALPMPLKILWQNGREVLLLAPAQDLQDRIKNQIALAMSEVEVADFRLRMLKMGATVNLLLHIKLGESLRLRQVSELDNIRRAVDQALAGLEGRVVADLVFIDDMSLAD